jgi:hypothetical protein
MVEHPDLRIRGPFMVRKQSVMDVVAPESALEEG